MEESKAKIETQFKLSDLAEKETEKIIARNRGSEIERYYVEKTGNDTRYEIRSAGIYGFQC